MAGLSTLGSAPAGLARQRRRRSPRTAEQGAGLGAGDDAAGLARQPSLGEPGRLARLCCCVPGVVLFSLVGVLGVTPFLCPAAFLTLTAVLSAISLGWTANMGVACVFGARRLRQCTTVDWHSKLVQLQEEYPEDSDVLHVVILPNYKEDENMLLQTLEGIAESPMARSCIRVVLAMEEREGPAAEAKASRLIARMADRFADICATYHPADLPGDLVGKSSNTQWAYQRALQRYAAKVAQLDASRVFITVGDADTLWHRQYFSYIAYDGLCMPKRERQWALWQPVMLLMRNLYSCPGPNRISGYITLMYELSGLVQCGAVPHTVFSSYSLTLKLASHRLVGGWDRDVIAEDHHMYIKCFAAPLWEQAQERSVARSAGATCGADADGRAAIVPRVHLRPVFLPATSFLIESSDGWLASVRDRFQQARRHSQGVAELSYLILQYVRLVRAVGARALAWATHRQFLLLIAKLLEAHIVSVAQGVGSVAALALLVPGAWRWCAEGGCARLLAGAAAPGLAATNAVSLSGARWAVCAIFGPVPPCMLLFIATTYVIARDLLEGRLADGGEAQTAARCVRGPAPGKVGLGLAARAQLLGMVANDWLNMGYSSLLVYSLVPISLACKSLMWKGPAFEYIVATKPTY